MPRTARVDVAKQYYHVINRANGRLSIFENKRDYRLFEEILEETKELFEIDLLAYVLMPNHWHLVLSPRKDGEMGLFMHRLTNSHTRKFHAVTKTNGAGHLYQGRYKSFLVDTDKYILSLIKYVERNPVRAKLAKRAEGWIWGSAYRRIWGLPKQRKLLSELPVPLSKNYLDWLAAEENENSLRAIRRSLSKGVPYGRESWVKKMVKKYHLESTLRPPGRPKKK